MSREKTNLTILGYVEDDLETTFYAIKELDGYNYTVREVVSWEGGEEVPFTGVWPAIGFVLGPEQCDDTFGVSMRRNKVQGKAEMWIPAPSNSRAKRAFPRAYQAIIADLEKALYVDHTRGGYAEDTNLLSRQPAISSDGTLIGGLINFEIIYRHAVGNLYTKQ